MPRGGPRPGAGRPPKEKPVNPVNLERALKDVSAQAEHLATMDPSHDFETVQVFVLQFENLWYVEIQLDNDKKLTSGAFDFNLETNKDEAFLVTLFSFAVTFGFAQAKNQTETKLPEVH